MVAQRKQTAYAKHDKNGHYNVDCLQLGHRPLFAAIVLVQNSDGYEKAVSLFSIDAGTGAAVVLFGF